MTHGNSVKLTQIGSEIFRGTYASALFFDTSDGAVFSGICAAKKYSDAKIRCWLCCDSLQKDETEMEVTDMALIRWNPQRELWDPFESLSDIREEMNRLFDRSFLRRGDGGLQGEFAPAIDVAEERDAFLIRADLPGLKRDDVSVTLQDNYLTIRGEKKHEEESKETSYYHRERVHGMFSRTIQLPTAVDAKRIDANFKDGVLQVRLPKSEEAKPKQIDVKVS